MHYFGILLAIKPQKFQTVELTRENECCVDNSHKVLNADDF